MRGLVTVSLVCSLTAIAGCVGSLKEDAPTSAASRLGWLAPPLEQALWDDPQQFPHPAFGWPTLTHVPAEAPEWWQPPDWPVPVDIEQLRHVTSAGNSIGADGMVLFGSLLVLAGGPPPSSGSLLMPAEIFDISDPGDPVLLASFEPDIPRRQVDLIAYPEGRLVVVFASDAAVLPVYDITDPTDPRELAVIELPSASHTVAVVPGTPLVYNANTAGSTLFPFHEASGARSLKQTEIYDLSDPQNPVLVQEFQNGLGCHEISFHITAEKQRAYCAGVDYVQIWDVTDPAAPEVLVTFPMGHGVRPLPGAPAMLTLAHTAIVNRDATVLVISDEMLGGNAPACTAHAQLGGLRASGPLGSLWFYDITDERDPRMLSWLSPGSALAENPGPHSHIPTGSCTAHVGHMVPHPSRDLLAVGFYAGGLLLVDFTDPSAPFIVDQWNPDGQILDVWYHSGALFAADIEGGFHVFEL